jgi:hypothetical protein
MLSIANISQSKVAGHLATRVVRLIESSGGGKFEGKKFLISDFQRHFAHDGYDRWGELSLMASPPNYILSSSFLIAFRLRDSSSSTISSFAQISR